MLPGSNGRGVVAFVLPRPNTAMHLRPLLVLCCLATFCAAQGGEAEAEAERIRLKRIALEEGSDLKESKEGEKDAPDEALAKMTPEQRLNHNIRHGASNYCTFTATPKPAKLLPGQSGVIVVTAILKGNAVLQAPTPLEVISSPQQGLATLGAPSFRPPELGKLEAGYRGRPVYENWLIFEVPVTMAGDAVLGRKQPVAMEMRFDLHDGSSAQAVGRFLDRVSTEIEVGLSADPAVAALQRSVAARAGAAPVTAENAGGSDAAVGKTAPAERVVQGAAIVPVKEAAPDAPVAPATSSNPLPLAEEDGALPIPLLVGGGAVVLLLVLLLIRRK